MTQTARNRTVEGMDTGEAVVRENDAHTPESVSRVKKKEEPAMVYITYMVLGAVFVLGCVCGRAFGNFGTTSLETSEVKSIIALLQEKNDNHLLEAADIGHLKQLVKELKYVDPPSPSHSKDPKHVFQMSHKEAMETLAQPVNPNAHRDFILDKLYTFLFFVILIVFWIFCTCIGA